MEWDWNFVWQIMPTLLEGLKITIIASILGAIVAAVVGLVFAILRRSQIALVSKTTGFVVEFIRGTPLLVQLYFIFYVLPDIGIRLPALVAGVIGLGLHYGTYAAEIRLGGVVGRQDDEADASGKRAIVQSRRTRRDADFDVADHR